MFVSILSNLSHVGDNITVQCRIDGVTELHPRVKWVKSAVGDTAVQTISERVQVFEPYSSLGRYYVSLTPLSRVTLYTVTIYSKFKPRFYSGPKKPFLCPDGHVAITDKGRLAQSNILPLLGHKNRVLGPEMGKKGVREGKRLLAFYTILAPVVTTVIYSSDSRTYQNMYRLFIFTECKHQRNSIFCLSFCMLQCMFVHLANYRHDTSRKFIYHNQELYYLILTFRSHHEIFVIRSWYAVLPSLDATISCRIKKAGVDVTQLIIALVSIHSSITYLADMNGFLDPPSRTVLFSVDDRSLFPVDCVIGLIRMVSEC